MGGDQLWCKNHIHSFRSCEGLNDSFMTCQGWVNGKRGVSQQGIPGYSMESAWQFYDMLGSGGVWGQRLSVGDYGSLSCHAEDRLSFRSLWI